MVKYVKAKKDIREDVFENYHRQQKKFKNYLISHGVSEQEVEELAKNSGLNGNPLSAKAKEIADSIGSDEWEKLVNSK